MIVNIRVVSSWGSGRTDGSCSAATPATHNSDIDDHAFPLSPKLFNKSCSSPSSSDEALSSLLVVQIKAAVVEAVHDLKTELRLEYQAQLNEINKKFSLELDSIRSDLASLKNRSESRLQNVEVELLHELKDSESRKNNLMIFGLSENNSLDKSTDKKEADLSSIRLLSSALGINDLKIHSCLRLGRPGGKPRPIKIVCPDSSQRSELLLSAYRISRLDSSLGFKGVFIKPDLSPKEQEINRRLRLELRTRREAGERVIIRGGRIISDTRIQTSIPRD